MTAEQWANKLKEDFLRKLENNKTRLHKATTEARILMATRKSDVPANVLKMAELLRLFGCQRENVVKMMLLQGTNHDLIKQASEMVVGFLFKNGAVVKVSHTPPGNQCPLNTPIIVVNSLAEVGYCMTKDGWQKTYMPDEMCFYRAVSKKEEDKMASILHTLDRNIAYDTEDEDEICEEG